MVRSIEKFSIGNANGSYSLDEQEHGCYGESEKLKEWKGEDAF